MIEYPHRVRQQLQGGGTMVVALAGSAVAHLSLSPGELSIFGAAAVLWLGDLLTLPLLLCPITDERPLRVLQTVAREGGFAEAIQYSIGILGVILIQQLPWTIVL